MVQIYAMIIMALVYIPAITAKSSTLRGLLGGACTGALIGGVAGGKQGAALGTVACGLLGTAIGASEDVRRSRNKTAQNKESCKKCQKHSRKHHYQETYTNEEAYDEDSTEEYEQ